MLKEYLSFKAIVIVYKLKIETRTEMWLFSYFFPDFILISLDTMFKNKSFPNSLSWEIPVNGCCFK